MAFPGLRVLFSSRDDGTSHATVLMDWVQGVAFVGCSPQAHVRPALGAGEGRLRVAHVGGLCVARVGSPV